MHGRNEFMGNAELSDMQPVPAWMELLDSEGFVSGSIH